MSVIPFRRRRPRSLARELPVIGLAFAIGMVGVYGFRDFSLRESAEQPTPPTSSISRGRDISFSMCTRGQGVNCVVDGDTIRLGDRPMRISGIDAPETYRNLCGGAREAALGRQSAARLRAILNGGPITIREHGQDRYGRVLVDVSVNGRDVGEMMIAERLARRWPDGAEWWCDR